MKKLLAIILILSCAYGSNAQSMFKPLRPQLNERKKLTLDTTQVGSPWKGFRFFGPSVLYAYDFSHQTSTIYTGVGVDYEWDTLTTSTGRYYTKFAVGFGLYGGGNIAPTNVSTVAAVGVHFYFFNKYLAVGVLYNITQKTIQPAVGGNANFVPVN